MKKYFKSIFSIAVVVVFLIMAWSSNIPIENQEAKDCVFLPVPFIQTHQINIKVLDKLTHKGIPNVNIMVSYYNWSKVMISDYCEFQSGEHDIYTLVKTNDLGIYQFVLSHTYLSNDDYIEIFVYIDINALGYKNKQDKYTRIKINQLENDITFNILKNIDP